MKGLFHGSSISRDDLAIIVPIFSIFLCTFIVSVYLEYFICLTMKLSSIFLTVSALATAGLAEKTCTPSFDYCSDVLIKDKGKLFTVRYRCVKLIKEMLGFTEADLKDVLKGSDLENEDIKNVLFHCKNPGDVGHPKLCSSGCKDPESEGSHSCSR